MEKEGKDIPVLEGVEGGGMISRMIFDGKSAFVGRRGRDMVSSVVSIAMLVRLRVSSAEAMLGE
jgi:hypothetical protein